MNHNRVKVGTKVTVKQPVTAYYSNYGDKPKLILKPGMIGTVGTVKVPYVRASKNRERGDYFACVDYLDPNSGLTDRAGVSYSNLVLIER